LPKDLTAKQLHEEFSKFGEIKSLKISLNPDHTSRRYGFVCFTSPEAAQKAMSPKATDAMKDGPYEVLRYAPKDKREFRKAFNNIYVKNFPVTWTEKEVRDLFGKHGHIKSLVMMKNPENTASFAFVCFENEKDPSDKEYGVKAAMSAVQSLHGMKIDDQHTLYVKEALKKEERAIEKKKEMMRYKNSKKRCNLYVKNFPPTTTAEELK
jgi:polyadenylate-binding protein